MGHALSVFFCWCRAILSTRKEVGQLPLKSDDQLPSKSFDDHLQQMSVILWKFFSGLTDSFCSRLISNAECIQLIRNASLLQYHLWMFTHSLQYLLHGLNECILVQVVYFTSYKDPEGPCKVHIHQCQAKEHCIQFLAWSICKHALLLQVWWLSQLKKLKNVLLMVD